MKKIHSKKVVLKKSVRKSVRKVGHKNVEHSSKYGEEVSVVSDSSEEDTTLDMTGWESDFHYESMRGLFFIQKGKCEKISPRVVVRDGKEYDERWVGGYDPSKSSTVEHYCVIDRVTYHTIYGGSSLEAALDTLTRCIVNYKNDCERYFRDVCEQTNEDFYFRHYMGTGHDSDETLKRRAEEGRSWKSSPHTKRSGYAVYKLYGFAFSDMVEEAEEKAITILEEKRMRRKEKKLNTKRKKIKIKRKK